MFKGKPSDSDLKNGLIAGPILFALSKLSKIEKGKLRNLLAKELNNSGESEAKTLFEKGLGECKERLQGEIQQSLELLKMLFGELKPISTLSLMIRTIASKITY